MLVTDSGTVIAVRPIQPEKASLPILANDSGSIIDIKPSQSAKALSPILVTNSGIVIVVKPFNPEQRPAGICSTWSPKVKVVIILLLASKRLRPILQACAFQVTDFKRIQLKAPLPILVTNSGIVIVVKPSHNEKALLPILVNDSGNVIVIKPLQC